MRGERSLQSAVGQLQTILAELTHKPEPAFTAMLAAQPAVLARFQPLFAPERIPVLTAEQFQAFLLFKYNRHWVGLHPQGPRLCADLDALRQALALLVDESRPLRERLDRLAPPGGTPLVPRLGRAVLTAILHIRYPAQYGVWNGVSELGLKAVHAWPPLGRQASLGERYVIINDILVALARALGVDLWTLDALWWRVQGPGQPRLEVRPRRQRGGGRRSSMAKRVVGWFADCSGAEGAVQELLRSGFTRAELSLMAEDETRGEYVLDTGFDPQPSESVGEVAKSAELGALAGGLRSSQTKGARSEAEAADYAGGVRRGGALLTILTTEDKTACAVEVLRHQGARVEEARGAPGPERGWTGGTPAAELSTAADLRQAGDPSHPPASAAAEVTIPVIEEEVQVGKRTVQRGGVRVSSRVTQTPVEETVHLREEQVTVERRPVERPAGEAEGAAFEEKTIEVTQSVEEPVLSKRVRVVEEVVVRKDVEERAETVRETARRTDVEVRPLGPEHRRGTKDFAVYEADFRHHYTTAFAASGSPYEQCAPAYRYGYELAADERYTHNDWAAVEPEARHRWEGRYPGTWEQFNGAIYYAWDKVRGQAHARRSSSSPPGRRSGGSSPSRKRST